MATISNELLENTWDDVSHSSIFKKRKRIFLSSAGCALVLVVCCALSARSQRESELKTVTVVQRSTQQIRSMKKQMSFCELIQHWSQSGKIGGKMRAQQGFCD